MTKSRKQKAQKAVEDSQGRDRQQETSLGLANNKPSHQPPTGSQQKFTDINQNAETTPAAESAQGAALAAVLKGSSTPNSNEYYNVAKKPLQREDPYYENASLK